MRATLMLSLLLVIPAGCKKSGDAATQKAAPTAPVKVPLFTAIEAPTPDVLTLTGMVAADQRSEVTADTQGKVVQVMVERGARVKFGDPMLRLDVRNAALSAREANANLESARAQKQLAEQECARAKGLFDKGAITRSEFDRQTTQCTSALQQVSAAQARTEMFAKSVNDGIVRAPFEGEIAERMVAPGEWVAPGRALFTLVDDDPLRIELSVPEIAVSAIQKGQRVELSAVARPGKTYGATISRIGAEIGRTRSLIVEATIDPKGAAPASMTPTPPAGTGSAAKPGAGSAAKPVAPPVPAPVTSEDGLVPGMFAEAHVTIGHTTHVVLPRSAVVTPCRPGVAIAAAPAAGSGSGSGAPLGCRGKTWRVFVVVKGGELEERVVQIGPEPEPGKVSIVQGVVKGDKVVETITDQITDGLRVVE